MAGLSTHDQYMKNAEDFTALQLQQAIDIVETKLGKDRAAQDGALIGAVLLTLAENYRHRAK